MSEICTCIISICGEICFPRIPPPASTLLLSRVIFELVFVHLIGVIVAAWLTIDQSRCELATDRAFQWLRLWIVGDLRLLYALHIRLFEAIFLASFSFKSFSTKQLEMM